MQHFVTKFSLILISLVTFHVAEAGDRSARPGAVPDFTLPRSNPTQVQVQTFSEGFDNIGSLAAAGWVMTNHSGPVGSTSWFQGTNVSSGGPFDAYDGVANSYIAANYNNTGSAGTISNWLLTPVLDFGSAQSFTFYTRKVSPDSYPDRLEVRFSTAGASSNVGTTATDVGDFTNLALSINPNLVLGVYPTTWTQYTITGLPHNGQGRIAFRYYVTGAGVSGVNSDYIGIDRVVFNASTPEYQVSATVTGLIGSGLSLSLNTGAPLSVAVDGSTVVFPQYLTDGSPYEVRVATSPATPSQTCLVSGGSGMISGADVNVTVTCTIDEFSIGGSVNGLVGSGLTLEINGGDPIGLIGDGGFTFPSPLPDLSTYVVTVAAQPIAPNQTCIVNGGNGVLAGMNVTNVIVTCTTNHYAVGGEVFGLNGASGLLLDLNGGNTIGIIGDGPFVFPDTLEDGNFYDVTVAAQPSDGNANCVVFRGFGRLVGSDVATVEVFCDVVFLDGFEGL